MIKKIFIALVLILVVFLVLNSCQKSEEPSSDVELTEEAIGSDLSEIDALEDELDLSDLDELDALLEELETD